MKRIELRVKGTVQKVGYRDRVQKLALDLGLTGYVENLPDLSVRIVCEGPEVELARFVGLIEIKQGFIEVQKVETVAEGEATAEFDLFRIKRGDMVEELGGRMDAGVMHLAAIRGDIQELGSELKASRKENRDGFESLRQETRELKKESRQGFKGLQHEITGFKDQTHSDFNRLDDKYHTVSDELKSLNVNVQNLTEIVGKALDRVLRVEDEG